MSTAWRDVQRSGLTDETELRAALVREFRARGVVDFTDTELDALVGLMQSPTRTGFRLLRDQALRTVGLFREMSRYAEPKWALPAKGVPSPPEPDLASVEIFAHLTADDLQQGRPVIRRLVSELTDQGDDGPELNLSPWISEATGEGVGVHIGGARVATIDGDRSRAFRGAIGRWGQGTGTLSVHATLTGDTADTAELRVFVSLPAEH